MVERVGGEGGSAFLLGAADPQGERWSLQRGLSGPVWGDGTCQTAPDTTTFLPTCLLGSGQLRGWLEGWVLPERVPLEVVWEMWGS